MFIMLDNSCAYMLHKYILVFLIMHYVVVASVIVIVIVIITWTPTLVSKQMIKRRQSLLCDILYQVTCCCRPELSSRAFPLHTLSGIAATRIQSPPLPAVSSCLLCPTPITRLVEGACNCAATYFYNFTFLYLYYY